MGPGAQLRHAAPRQHSGGTVYHRPGPGTGGFGVTYVALDHQRGAKVAIKEYLPTAAAHRVSGSILVSPLGHDEADAFRYGLECFLEEARILAKFSDNPRIVGVRSFFQENGTAYFVMDYIEGISFKAYLRSHGGRINEITALQILQPVIYALQDVHQEGLIHRDVTPDNIYIAGDLPAHRPAASGQVKLLDFGAARYSLGDRSRSLDVILKSGYAPKEQYTRRSRQGPYTDVYSVAACLYAAVTGSGAPSRSGAAGARRAGAALSLWHIRPADAGQCRCQGPGSPAGAALSDHGGVFTGHHTGLNGRPQRPARL